MERPFVLANAAVSIDGKLAPASRARFRLGSDRDRLRMDRLRASSDAILIGAGTLRAEDPPLQVRSAALLRLRARQGHPACLLEIVVSRSLRLPMEGRFFRPGQAPRLLVVPGPVGARKLAAARRHHEVLHLPGKRPTPVRLLSALARRGVRRLLVEGGGEIFAWFFASDLIDEIHLTVCPWLIGGARAPTLFDGTGFDAPLFPRMALDLCRREGEEIYLRYRAKRP